MRLEKTLESPLDCQAILEEISPEYSLEGLMLKLKFQYLGHLMRRADLFEKTLKLGKIEGRRRRGLWKFMAHILLKPGLENSGHCFASMRDECNCAAV